MYPQLDPPPPKPRLGGRAPAILGVVGLVLAVVIFGLVLLDPFGSEAGPQLRPPAPSVSARSAMHAETGDCLKNQGNTDKPAMIVVACAPGTFEVLQRLEGTMDVAKCQDVPDSGFHYFYDSNQPDTFDFVLCMRKRP
jgi:hypothetical protein